MTEKVLVVCPGRGTYTKAELGYLKKYHLPRHSEQSEESRRDPSAPPQDDETSPQDDETSPQDDETSPQDDETSPQDDEISRQDDGFETTSFIARTDQRMKAQGKPTISELDNAATFSLKTHTPGELASVLIYACSQADYLNINRERYEVVAITGNSMGWYTTLALAKAVNEAGSFTLIDTMGSMMKDKIIGGQIIYPVINGHWQIDPEKVNVVDQIIAQINATPDARAYISIDFGGYAVIGSNEQGIQLLKKLLPPLEDKYPMQLVNHAAFHTPLLQETSDKAFQLLSEDLFSQPQVPIIDGRGHVWQPYSTNPKELRQYSLGEQVVNTYNFTTAMTVALKEFAPTKIIVLGPGTTLGGAIGQILVKLSWLNIKNKDDFQNLQRQNPFVLAMGRADQWSEVASSSE